MTVTFNMFFCVCILDLVLRLLGQPKGKQHMLRDRENVMTEELEGLKKISEDRMWELNGSCNT